MSEELKRKLYNYEADPPGIVWSRIVTALDQEINAEFPEKLYDLEVTPPLDAWSKIEEGLHDEGKEQYPTKLYNVEVTPPAGAWNKILPLLDQEKVPSKTSSKGKIIPFVKYAAAACIIGLLALGALKLLNQTVKAPVDKAPITAKEISPKKDSGVNRNQGEQLILPPSNNLPKEAPALARAEIKSRKKNLPEEATYMTQMAANYSTASGTKVISDFRQASLKGDIPGNCSQISDADPYLMFMNPDGYLVRISKKLAETLGCVYSNGNSDESNRCQDQIKKWRDKIAQSSATSSPDNFMDILNVIKSVQE
ncbi:MAG TPA: hypothetical protein VGQ53_10755 [Chitinophagaceae bacterium]|jgi:hypothetical protein|nr:hypothetical protein [Chitinophagaceae bacterium]